MKRMRLTEARTRAGSIAPVLAWFGLFVTAGGVLVARLGDVGPWPVITVISAGWAISTMALLLAVAGLVVVWRQGLRGGGRAMHGLIVSCLALVWPAALIVQVWQLPDMTDVSTDVFTPPGFSEAPQIVAARGGVVLPSPASRRSEQGQSHQMALPLFLDQPPADASKAVETAARSLGWTLIDTQFDADGGARFEAIARSDLLRFPQYAVARVRPTADGAQLDVRVASRFARFSPGSNVQRILDLHEAVQAVED